MMMTNVEVGRRNLSHAVVLSLSLGRLERALLNESARNHLLGLVTSLISFICCTHLGLKIDLREELLDFRPCLKGGVPS